MLILHHIVHELCIHLFSPLIFTLKRSLRSSLIRGSTMCYLSNNFSRSRISFSALLKFLQNCIIGSFIISLSIDRPICWTAFSSFYYVLSNNIIFSDSMPFGFVSVMLFYLVLYMKEEILNLLRCRTRC